MNYWQFSVPLIPMLLTCLTSVVLSGIAWRRREYQYARSLVALLFAVTWWSLAYIVGFGTTIPWVKRLAYGLTYPAIGTVAIAWFVFSVQYTGRLRVPTKREFAVLGIVPVVAAVAALTNQTHGLMWSSVDTVSRGQPGLMMTSPGILFWAHTLQSYALMGVGTVLLVVMAVLSNGAYRSEAVSLVLAAVLPMVANVTYLTGLTTPVDLTPAAFALSGTAMIATVYRDQFLQSLPLAREIARDEVIKQMGSPLIVLDKRKQVVDINPAAESLADTAGTVVGSQFESVFPEISNDINIRGETANKTQLRKTIREQTRHYEVETLQLARGGGAVKGVLVKLEDITELKDRQQELFDERQFIDQSLDTLDDLFYVVEVDGTLRRWNKQFTDITGYGESELNGMHALELFPDDDRERVADGIETTLQKGEVTVEAELLTANGERIPHEFTGARLEAEDGTPTGIVGVGRDISDRKERERRLRTFREVVENAGRMIYWMDSDHTVEYVNPALETQIERDPSDLVGEQTFPLADRAQSETLADSMLDTLSHGETWNAEFTTTGHDGKRRRIDQTVTPVYDDGRVERFVAVAGDITERKRRKQQLSVLQRILRHDLRNNLNEILLSVQLANREATEDAVRQQLDGAEQTIEETLSLSRDVKQFRQAFEAGGAGNRVVDIVEAAREQLATVRAERPNVEFSAQLPGTARVVTNGMIEQAIRNVLRNAVEHNNANDPEVTVTVGPRAETDDIELQIADNGPGIPDRTVELLDADHEEQLDHLDGFGLWLVNWVLTLSGGSLEFAENTPRGTVVKLVLPVAQAAEHPPITQ